MSECSKRYNVPLEFVVVDWPVEYESPARERIMKALAREGLSIPDYVQQLRIIEVPKEFISMSPPSLPVLEYTGKNIGARRALGKLLLLGGTDSLPHEKIFKYLSSHSKNITGCIGAIRQSYTRGLFPTRPYNFEQFVEWRDSRETKAWKAPGKYRHLVPPVPILKDTKHWNAAGDFTLCTRPALAKIGGYPETSNRYHVDTALLKIAQLCSVRLQVFHSSLSCFHQPHSKTVAEPFALNFEMEECPKEPHNFGFPDKIMGETLFTNGKKEFFPFECIPTFNNSQNESLFSTKTKSKSSL